MLSKTLAKKRLTIPSSMRESINKYVNQSLLSIKKVKIKQRSIESFLEILRSKNNKKEKIRSKFAFNLTNSNLFLTVLNRFLTFHLSL